MKRLLLLLVSGFLLMTCSSKQDPLPEGVWQEGCLELVSDKDQYVINGICCALVTFPRASLDKNRSFISNGTYSTFTGFGYTDSPLVVSGQLLADGSLTIIYTVGNTLSRHVFKPGRAAVACSCVCR